MKFIKTFESYSNHGLKIDKVDGVIIKDVDRKIEKGEFQFDEVDFMLSTWLDGREKSVSIPHDVFLEYIESKDPSLKSYLTDFENIDDIYQELASLGWSFSNALQEFVNDRISESDFDIIDEFEQYKKSLDETPDDEFEEF
jgi:hypothetical protein